MNRIGLIMVGFGMPLLACVQQVVIPKTEMNEGYRWRPKTIDVSVLPKRAQFPVYAPRSFGAFKLDQVQIIWIPRIEFTPKPMPARQAIRLHYQSGKPSQNFDILFTPHYEPYAVRNMEFVFDAECFGIRADYGDIETFSQIYGETKKVDLYFVSRTTSQEDAYKIFNPFLAAFKQHVK